MIENVLQKHYNKKLSPTLQELQKEIIILVDYLQRIDKERKLFRNINLELLKYISKHEEQEVNNLNNLRFKTISNNYELLKVTNTRVYN